MTYDPEYIVTVGDADDQLYRRMAQSEKRAQRRRDWSYIAWWLFAALFCVGCWWGVAYVLGWL